MNADLHCHSTVSDGALAPAEVARRAHAGGVTLWALTDHDEIGGQVEAREAAEALGMQYLSGVEISVTWASRTIHIVGLHVDPACKELVEGLCRNSKAYRDACDKRKVAVDKTAAFIDSLDVDEGFKTKMTRELRYFDSLYLIH